MPVRQFSIYMIRFLALFTGGAALVLFWVTMESLYIKRLTFAYLFRFSLPATFALLAGLIVLLELYAGVRLARLLRRSSTRAADASEDDRIVRSLLRLPTELFWWTVAYAVLFIPVYHVTHYVVEGHSVLHVGESYWMNFVRSFLYELTVSLSAAILHYTVARRLIRPALTGLRAEGDLLRGRSFLTMLTTTFAALLLVNLFSILWYVLVSESKQDRIDFAVLASMVGLEVLFAVIVFLLLATVFRRELRLMTGSIRTLLGGGRARSDARMPILSDDEVGQLAAAFNRLQERVNRDYDEVAEELRLARQFQLQLLPPNRQTFGAVRVAAVSEPRREVASGFYDIVPLTDGRFAAVAGEVSGGGMPAALQMSALLLLLRAEIHRDGAPQAMLERFRQTLREVFPREAGLSAALAVVDPRAGSARIAADGGMSVRLQARDGRMDAWPSKGESVPFRPGDALIICSPAARQAGGGDAEARLLRLNAGLPLERQLGDSLARFRAGTGAKTAPAPAADGDFTLLLITHEAEAEKEAAG